MKYKYAISFSLIAILLYGLQYGISFAQIGAAYNAKMMCSCVFISKRSQSSIEKEDLYTIPFATQQVDFENKIVSSSIYGITKKAIFRPGLGCTILNKSDEKTILSQWQGLETNKTSSYNFPLDTIENADLTNKISKIFDKAFDEQDSNKIKRTRATLVVHNGHLIAERYGYGIDANTPLIGWSMTKSITNAMIGLLVKENRLTINDSNLFKEWKHDDRKNITIDQLLRMSSGLAFKEKYTTVSDATKMLFTEFGAGKYAKSNKINYPPDTKWYYSSGTTNILQELIRSKCKDPIEYLNFPHQQLFNKLGMQTATIEPDASGTYVGSSYMFASARDWAKFAVLYANDGIWNGENILPDGWVNYSSTVAPASDGEYAAHFWTYPRKSGLPDDSFLMDGFEGQLILIIPSKKLVLLRMGCTPKSENFDGMGFFKELNDLF